MITKNLHLLNENTNEIYEKSEFDFLNEIDILKGKCRMMLAKIVKGQK